MSSTSEAATSTDDIYVNKLISHSLDVELQGPLCLFYFECPFAILSATPPRRVVMPHWSEQPPYYDTRYRDDGTHNNHTGYPGNGSHHPTNASFPPHESAYYGNGTYPNEGFHEDLLHNGYHNAYQNGLNNDSSGREPTLKPTEQFPTTGMPFNPENKFNFNTYTKLSFDLGQAKVHRKPLTLSPFPTTPCFTYANTTWLDSSTPTYVVTKKRKCKKKLPPLELPSPKEYEDLSTDLSTDWLSDFKTKTKISLPPISIADNILKKKDKSVIGVRERQGIRLTHVGVRKKRSQLSGIRRTMVALMQRKLKGCVGLSRVLRLVKRRAAWSDPRLIKSSSSSLVRSSVCEQVSIYPPSGSERDRASVRRLAAMLDVSVDSVPRRRMDVSRGLLHRRYSMPETVMRKYHLAQSLSECDELSVQTCPSPAAFGGGQHRLHDIQDMRKSALTRKWRLPTSSSPQPRSLDGSYSDLRSRSRRHSPAKSLRKHLCEHLIQSTCRSNDQLNSYTESSSEALQTETDTKSNGSNSEVNESLVKSNINSLEGNKLLYNEKNVFCHVNINQINETNAQESSSLLIANSATDNALETESPNNNENNSITSDTFSSSLPTAKEVMTTRQINKETSNSGHHDVRIAEFSNEYENYENNIVPYYESVPKYPNYEMLEIVVSETINQAFGDQVSPDGKCASPEKVGTQIIRNMKSNGKTSNDIDIDEYISNILVESLHSLTDQIESMNACMGNDRKICIVEKEIKVKLQNTGMNTIVHLSPTSNNPIIFGNEELYHNDEENDSFNNNISISNALLIRDETASAESNINCMITPETCQLKSAFTIEDQQNANMSNSLHNDTVNHAVLQQIQKLFQDEFRSFEPDCSIPVISHIKMSNVDVFVDENQPNFETIETLELYTHRNLMSTESIMNEDLLSTVGAGNYYNVSEPFMVPRYNAIPHTTSMEVNTSSSESEQVVSDCTSLVDSLDDPNSPRFLLTKNCKEHNLVRSAIDVLSLLPETDRNDSEASIREKGESFYIRIKDNHCDCEKENIVVADHMPEKIKEKLLNRHKRREMRIKCARYKKAKQLKRELEKQQYHGYMKSNKQLDTDCMSIVNLLIDEIIQKIAHDEYKYMRIKDIKKKNTKKAHDILNKPLRKSTESLHNLPLESNKIIKKVSSQFSKSEGNLKSYTDRPHIKGKLSLQPSPPSHIETSPKRIYQKSEFHDGNNCIEILEILEYSDRSQSSPETNSDENQCHSLSKRKSKIPIPVNERIRKSSKLKSPKHRKYCNYDGSSNEETNDFRSLESHNADLEPNNQPPPKHSESTLLRQSQKKTLTSNLDSRSCSNSVKFKRVFEIIPEEKYGLNSESSNAEVYSNRRPSAPTLPCFRDMNDSTSILTTSSSITKYAQRDTKENKSLKHTETSPVLCPVENKARKYTNTQQKLDKATELRHVSTSPIGRNLKVCSNARRPPTAQGSRDSGIEQVDRQDTKSASTQYENSTSSDRNNENNQTRNETTKPNPVIEELEKYNLVKGTNSSDIITKRKVRKLDEKRLSKKRVDMENERRRLSLATEMRSMSDPQLNQIALRKKERRKGTEQVMERRGDASMSSSGDSSSLLCCGARGRGKGRGRPAGGGAADCGEAASGRGPGATQPDVTPSSAWSVTVGGAGGGGLLPQQLQMRLSFAPPPGTQQPITSTLPPVTRPSSTHQTIKSALPAVAPPPPLVLPPADSNYTQVCRCRHCAECSCPQINQQRSFIKGLLPGVCEASRRVSAQAPSPPRAHNYTRFSESLCVRGAGVLPSRKPRAPNASERDVTRGRARVRARQSDTRLAALLHHSHWR